MSDAATTPGIGDNSAAADPTILLREQLEETHAPLLERQAQLLAMEARLPESCEDEDWAAKLADGIKACTAYTKNSEATRLAANEPYRAGIRTVDGFFKANSDKVDALKTKMGAILTAYQRKVADAERRRLEAIAAEEKKRQQEAEAKAREEARIAREAQEAEQRRQEEARKAAAKLEGEKKAKAEAEERKRREAAEAEQKRLDDAARSARDTAREVRQDATVAKVEAGAKAADLSRSRSTAGSVASLRVTWDFEVTDESLVPRQYLGVKETAIRVAIKAATTPDNKCTLKIPGVKIFAKEETVVR